MSKRPNDSLHRSTSSASPLGAAGPLSLHGAEHRFLSPPIVLSRIHTLEGLKSRKRARSDEEIRSALALAVAASEILLEKSEVMGEGEILKSREVSLSEVDRRSGLTPSQRSGALALLSQAEVLHSVHLSEEKAKIRFFPEVLDAQPGLARLNWERARRELEQKGASVAPALAVLREIAQDSGMWPTGSAAPWVEVTYDKLQATTFFGRSSVAAALQALEEGGLLERGERRQRRSLYRLTSHVLGLTDTAPNVREPSTSTSVEKGEGEKIEGEKREEEKGVSATSEAPFPPIVSGSSQQRGAAPQSLTEGKQETVLQLGSTRVLLPAGTEAALSWDEEGRAVLKISPPS